MNLRKSIAAVALAVALGTAGAAAAGGRGNDATAYYVDAPVVGVEPVYQRVTVTTPREACWDEQVERVVRERGRGRGPSTSTVVGTILGGAIGNNIADGRDRATARIAGAVLGAAIGRDVGRHGARTRRVVSTERRCEVEQVTHTEERLDGYRVTYLHEGRRLVTHRDTDPGETIRLRVQVAPIYNDGY
ncbi:MAG: glycine zipper 2TM domain-containing protein [Halofilum sp. (in: g-proteobacteria)]|nr:glycine zipper 2TM domain-containing protein [Halofilum sp. (in: g-proteobacteria)]